MNALPKSEKAIKITSVANGYTVEMPTGSDPMTEMLSGYVGMIQEAMQNGEMNDVERLIKDSLKDVAPQPVLPTEKNVHIFATFTEVLDFLEQTVK